MNLDIALLFREGETRETEERKGWVEKEGEREKETETDRERVLKLPPVLVIF